jgi:hypothetical protein
MNLNAGIEREESRLGDSGDLRSILHLEKDERRSLTVAVGKINDLRLQIAKMDWIVAPSLPIFAAALPDPTGMLTFSKKRMLHLQTVGVD